MFILLQGFLFIISVPVFLLASYLLILSIAAQRAPRKTQVDPGTPPICFLIVIPAHNEELLLPSLLENLSNLDYPAGQYQIHLIADNCTDNTAQVGQAAGVIVHQRSDPQHRGKGYALQWLLEKLWQSGTPHDAIVFLDADSVISRNFLRVMAAHLGQGETIVQAYYTVRNPKTTLAGGWRFAALAVLHYLRPQSRMVLGGSAGLKGNGMMFAAPVMRQYSWSGSVTEDIELHMALILAGQRVYFAPEAVVWGEMPDTLAHSQSQHARWESGRIQTARRFIPELLAAARNCWKSGDKPQVFRLLDAAFEHVMPPFSFFAALNLGLILMSGLGLVTEAVVSGRNVFSPASLSVTLAWLNLLLGLSAALWQGVYLFNGLRLVNAPRHIYKQLLFTPLYVIWKLRQYLSVLVRQENRNWIRTSRNEI